MSLARIMGGWERFREAVRITPTAGGPDWPHSPKLGRDLLESMLTARHLDRAALALRAAGVGHYTISSAGHECNAVFGALTRTADPAFVHYRSAALFLERARQVSSVNGVRDIALSLVGSREDPCSGGRHKVFGRRELGIVPQTSTIASHLPRAVGLAFALAHGRRMRLPEPSRDAVVLASFGDASVNHSTWLGAVNCAGWIAHQHFELPLLLVCEDNGLGISVRSPAGWVEQRLRQLPHVRYFAARGEDLAELVTVASDAIAFCRERRRPAVFHLDCVRLLGHAGADLDTVYRTPGELAAAEERDPVLNAALTLIRSRVLRPQEVLALEDETAKRVEAAVAGIAAAPGITMLEELAAPLRYPSAGRRRRSGAPETSEPPTGTGGRTCQGDPNEPLTLAQGLNRGLGTILRERPAALVFGQDVARKGGVFGVTRGLLERFGPARVFNMLLDEQSILGLALGLASAGMLPLPEIQYLAFLHNAEDQLRGEAATLPFFSSCSYDNPLVVRVAGLAGPDGPGGHFHNENSLAVLRDIPGLVVCVPARADDATALLAAAVDLAWTHRRVVVVVEPAGLYHERDLHGPGDGAWLAPATADAAPFSRARCYLESAPDLTIATFGRGVRLALRVARRLAVEAGKLARVLDLRWLSPLPTEDVLDHARATGNLLVVDECRRSGSVSEALAAAILDADVPVRFARVTAEDCLIPMGRAAQLVLPNEDEILRRALELLRAPQRR